MDGLSSNKLTWRVTSLQPDVQQTLLEWRTAVFFMLPVTLVMFPLLEAISLFLLPRSSAGIFTAPSGNCRCSATNYLLKMAILFGKPNVSSFWEFHLIWIPDRLWAVQGSPGSAVLLRWTQDALLSTNSYDAV